MRQTIIALEDKVVTKVEKSIVTETVKSKRESENKHKQAFADLAMKQTKAQSNLENQLTEATDDL